jgi:hypothetical protein
MVSMEASKTRNKETKQNLISECRKLRAKPVRDEAYLQATFSEDEPIIDGVKTLCFDSKIV